MIFVALFAFCALTASGEIRSNPALNLSSDEQFGFIKSDPDGPSVHLSNSEVMLRLCFFDSSPELIKVRFDDGQSLDNFPINATIHSPVNKINSLPVVPSEDGRSDLRTKDTSDAGQTFPVSTEIPGRLENATESGIGNRYENLTFNPETLGSSMPNRSSRKNGAEAVETSTGGLVASCSTLIRHSYANPGLYRIEAEVIRPRNLTLTISPAWIRIASFEFLVGRVLLFNQTDRLLTFETARFMAAVRDVVQLSLVAEVNYGDGTPTKGVELYKGVSLPEWVPSVPWLVDDYRKGMFDHAYAYPGTYTITVKVSRHQPQKGTAKTEMVMAQTTLTVETFAQRIGDHLLFYEPHVRTFPREDFEVVAMIERLPSENTRVNLDFGDGTPSVSVQLERTTTPRPEWTRFNDTDHYYWTLVKHRFSLPGAFQMKMVISRSDFGESRVIFFCPVVVYDFLVDVKNVRLLLPVAEGQGQNKVTKGESVMFVVLIRSRPEADLEVLLNFGDGTEQQKIDYTSVALASLPHGTIHDLPDANHVGLAHHVYTSEGTFEAKVLATNVVLKRFREATFTAGTVIQVVACSSLPVWIGGVQRTYGRWEEVVLDAYVAPGCEDETMGTGEKKMRGQGDAGVSREGEMGGDNKQNGEELGVGVEAIEADKMVEEEEGRENKGTSEQEETEGGGGENGGGGDGDWKGKGGKRIGRRLLAEWTIILVGHSSAVGSAWTAYPKSTGFDIHFPPYSLPVGEHEFQIELTRLSPDDSTPLGRTVNRTKVIVTPMNFKVQVEPDTQRIDLSTEGVAAVFKAVIVPEIDWDDLDQPFNYEWFCVTQKLNADGLDLSGDPGCYGDRPKMDGVTSLFGIEPNRLVFNALPAVYYIYARATRSALTVTSLPAEVWLDAKSDLNVTVVCFINCDAFLSANETLTLSYTCSNCNRPSHPFPRYSILSSSSYFSSSSSASSSSSSSFSSKDRNLNFSWTIEPLGSGIDLVRNSLTGSNSDWLVIPCLVFYEKLTLENQTHSIKLTVTDGLRSLGRASYTVSVSARLNPFLMARGDLPSRASSSFELIQRDLLLCVTIAGILRQMTSLRYIT